MKDEQQVKVCFCFILCIAMPQCTLICSSFSSHVLLTLTGPFFCFVLQFLDGWVIFAEYAKPRPPPEETGMNSQPQQSWGAPSGSWGAQ
jgi:hypothetical protein